MNAYAYKRFNYSVVLLTPCQMVLYCEITSVLVEKTQLFSKYVNQDVYQGLKNIFHYKTTKS